MSIKKLPKIKKNGNPFIDKNLPVRFVELNDRYEFIFRCYKEYVNEKQLSKPERVALFNEINKNYKESKAKIYLEEKLGFIETRTNNLFKLDPKNYPEHYYQLN